MKTLMLFFFSVPAILLAETKVLVDAIPSDATFLGSSMMGLPFAHAESQDVKSIETGMSEAVLKVREAASLQGFSYVCHLSVAGQDPIEISIPTAETKLKMRRRNTSITVLFYKDGHAASPGIGFSAGKVRPGRPQVSMQIDKISPAGSTPADWIYLNLPRIQSEAAKSAAPMVMLEVVGEGPFAEVTVPGMKEPLLVPEGNASLVASWYIDGVVETPSLRKPQDVHSF